MELNAGNTIFSHLRIPSVIFVFFIVDRDKSFFRKCQFVHIRNGRPLHSNIFRVCPFYHTGHALRIITIPHGKKCFKASTRTAGCRRKIHSIIRPANLIHAFCIGLIVEVILCLAIQCTVIISIDQHLSIDNDTIIGTTKILSIGIVYLIFLCLCIYHLGKLIYQICSLVTEFISMSTPDFDHIDFFIKCCNLLRNSIDCIHTALNLFIAVFLHLRQTFRQ